LILSIAKYASPSGKKIQDEAVTPNVVVASAQENEEQAANAEKGTRTDEQLNKALDLLKQKNG
jgi:carboxyl-terminal processing protease